MSIAALSVGMNQARVQQGLDVAVLKQAMEMPGQLIADLMADLPVASDPNVGATVDVFA